jgi:glycerophosphoryl diester phosphodiesterase
MDVRSTADGALVVIHDETVDRTTDGSGPVTGFTLDELQQLDAGYRWTADEGETFPFRGQGITIPTFEAVLTTFPTTSMIVDIKQADPPIVAPFCTLIREHQMAERVIVGSFDDATLNTFRETCPEVATSATAGEVKALVILSKLFLGRLHSPKGVALQVPEAHDGIHILSRRFIKTAHQRNLCIQAWTINEEDDMRRLIAEGVDGIISDYPDRLLRVVGER